MIDFVITAPATSANLGPGFDFLGVSLSLYNRYEFIEASEFSLYGFSEDVKENYVLKGYKSVFDYLGKDYIKVTIKELIREIPIARGLGSSSAALASGILAGNYILGNPLSTDELNHLAIKLEGHPDNIIPCIYGGLVSTVNGDTIITKKFEVNSSLGFIALIPRYKVLTEMARSILPKTYKLADVTYNASRVMLFSEAFRTGDINLLKSIMEDKVHEPYRKTLIKEFDVVKDALTSVECTCNISGSGPTILVIVKEKDIDRIIQTIKDLNLELDIKKLSISDGIKIEAY